jgi:hypothetical protein
MAVLKYFKVTVPLNVHIVNVNTLKNIGQTQRKNYLQISRLQYRLYINVTVHHSRFIFNETTRRSNYPILFCHKTLHVSGIFSVHHQEFSAVHSALVIFMQVFDVHFQATVIKNLHETYQCQMYSRKLLMMGKEDARNM